MNVRIVRSGGRTCITVPENLFGVNAEIQRGSRYNVELRGGRLQVDFKSNGARWLDLFGSGAGKQAAPTM
jgi:hypothetical protein